MAGEPLLAAQRQIDGQLLAARRERPVLDQQQATIAADVAGDFAR